MKPRRYIKDSCFQSLILGIQKTTLDLYMLKNVSQRVERVKNYQHAKGFSQLRPKGLSSWSPFQE